MEIGKLLGTKKGIEAMVKFLEKTGAFSKTRKKKMPKMTPTIEDEEIEEKLVEKDGREWRGGVWNSREGAGVGKERGDDEERRARKGKDTPQHRQG